MFLSSVKVQSFRSYFDDKHNGTVYKARNRTAIRARPIFILTGACMRKKNSISGHVCPVSYRASGIYLHAHAAQALLQKACLVQRLL